jgi:hypothetical protein
VGFHLHYNQNTMNSETSHGDLHSQASSANQWHLVLGITKQEKPFALGLKGIVKIK